MTHHNQQYPTIIYHYYIIIQHYGRGGITLSGDQGGHRGLRICPPGTGMGKPVARPCEVNHWWMMMVTIGQSWTVLGEWLFLTNHTNNHWIFFVNHCPMFHDSTGSHQPLADRNAGDDGIRWVGLSWSDLYRHCRSWLSAKFLSLFRTGCRKCNVFASEMWELFRQHLEVHNCMFNFRMCNVCFSPFICFMLVSRMILPPCFSKRSMDGPRVLRLQCFRGWRAHRQMRKRCRAR